MKKSITLVAVLAFLGLAAFAFFGVKPESKIYAEEDASKIIEIEVGDIFKVELKENPSTGFSWHCRVDQETVIILDAEQFSPSESEQIVGAAGKHEFVFKAMKVGAAQVTFEYYQSWEPENIDETYVFNFVVQ